MLREVADREVVNREVVDREVEEQVTFGAGIILSAFCLLALFCFMFKVVFIVPVSVHGPEFKRSECMYLIS